VWDTAGVERFRTLTRNYYRNADATVFVYSVTDTASLHYLTQWLKDAQSHAPDALRVIVGNKIDLKGSIEVEESVAQAFADLQKIKSVYRISCKTNEGVDNFITELTREIHRRSQDGADVHIDEDALRVGPKTPAQDQQPGEGGGCRC
jgi:small GTP-binding protein